MTNLIDKLDRLTVASSELVEKHADGSLRCFACAHRCLIKPGRRGICQVRFNQEGELRVPWGYVAACQVDPIEKKPFSHFLPGSDALTFGMLGCDLHCSYCFPGETMVVTNRGPISLASAFEQAEKKIHQPDAEIAFPHGLEAVTNNGEYHAVRGIFKHAYHGNLTVIKPYYLPELRCTPDHKIYATLSPGVEPAPIPARDITKRHYLAVPRNHAFGLQTTLDSASLIGRYPITYKVPWKFTPEQREWIAAATRQGLTSKEIGAALGTSGSYIRQVRGKLARGAATDVRTSVALVEDGYVRFPNEHRPGTPRVVCLDERMAKLLGFYAAEGSVVRGKDRPNSFTLSFSFSPDEVELAGEVIRLLDELFAVRAQVVRTKTTTRAYLSKASIAILFETLGGKGAEGKLVPQVILNAGRPVAQAYLDACVSGDGHRYENGKISLTTVSKSLAYGLAWLALKLGYLPSVYEYQMPGEGSVEGRRVKRAPVQYSVVWYEHPQVDRKFIECENYYLIPLRSLSTVPFDGEVYNLEVDQIHNYMANFMLVSNCQNWITSQFGRDEQSALALSQVEKTQPEALVQLAQRSGAQVVVSSYNEPLITSEWALAIFKQARACGLKCAYVSNGNATPELIKYLAPYLTGYKIDLKSMQDKQYRKLGCVLNNVLDTIKLAHDAGLWVEVVTLVVPGFNDSPSELWDAARFIASVSPDIPWHVTAFHPDYKMDANYTPASTLQTAAEIGQEAGLHFVYAGNLPGRVGEFEDTFCPHCNTRLIERSGYVLQRYQITADGKCPSCRQPIPGVWTDQPESVRLGGPGFPRRIRI